MIKKLLILLPFLVIGLLSYGQTILLETEHEVEDDQFKKSQSIVPIYKYQGLSIEPYTKFGVDMDEDQDWYRIKRLPAMGACRDTAYTYIYFAGADNDRSQAYILAMVGNYYRSRRTVYFWIDRNNDLDFTNDGPPDSLLYKDHNLVIRMSNKSDSSAKYAIKLSRLEYGENVRYKRLLNDHYKAHSGSKKFTSVNFCYREQRYNTVVANYNNGTDSFSLGLKDMNVNGFYDEAEIDKFYIGAYGSRVEADKTVELSKKKSENSFEWNGKKYVIEGISRNGKTIELSVVEGAELTQSLEMGKSTPDFEYFNIINHEHKLSEFKKSRIFLYFWDNSTLSPEDTTYLAKIHREFGDKIKVLSLNHGDEPKMVRMTFYYDKLSFPVGYSNASIAELYFLEDVPRGYYLDKKCVLVKDRISPKEMYDILLSEKKGVEF
ncbi:MAG: hypothetical protein JXR19_02000 [Bacteroidia bacterium]